MKVRLIIMISSCLFRVLGCGGAIDSKEEHI